MQNACTQLRLFDRIIPDPEQRSKVLSNGSAFLKHRFRAEDSKIFQKTEPDPIIGNFSAVCPKQLHRALVRYRGAGHQVGDDFGIFFGQAIKSHTLAFVNPNIIDAKEGSTTYNLYNFLEMNRNRHNGISSATYKIGTERPERKFSDRNSRSYVHSARTSKQLSCGTSVW